MNSNQQFAPTCLGAWHRSRVLSLVCLLCFFTMALIGCSFGGSSPPSLPSALAASCLSATVGTNYTCTISVSDGKAPFAWSVSGLPAGLMFTVSPDTTTLTISGTPQAQQPAQRRATRLAATSVSANVSVTVTDKKGRKATLSFTITISGAVTTLAISTTSLPNGTANTAYSQSLAATGGQPPYTWSLLSGTLPTNFTLSSGGVISGTTTETGMFSFTVEVMDSESPAPQTATQPLSFTINAAAASCVLSGKQFAFELTGADTTGFANMVGSLTVASDGSISVGALDFRNQTTVLANQAITGGPGSCSNGSVSNAGSIAFTAGGTQRTLYFAMRTADGNRGFVVESGDGSGFTGSGHILYQDKPAAGLGGSLAFGLVGGNTTEAFAVIGSTCTNAQGGVTFLEADFDVGGTLTNMVMEASSNAGTFSAPDSNGRVTTTSAITYQDGTSVDITAYVVDGNTAFVISTGGTYPTSGSTTAPIPPEVGLITGQGGSNCLPLGQGGSFSNSSVGNSVFSARGPSKYGIVGVLNNFDASAGTASVTDDLDLDGTSQQKTAEAVTYSVSSAGRLSVTSSADSATSYAYLDGAGSGYLIVGDKNGQGVAFGILQSQTATTIGTGTFAFGTQFVFPASGLVLYPVTEVSISGTSTSGTITDMTSGGSTGSYTCGSAGRCTAPSLSNNETFGDTSIVFYVVGNMDSATTLNAIEIMQVTATDPEGGSLLQ